MHLLAVCFQKAEGGTKTSWNERSELCLLKVDNFWETFCFWLFYLFGQIKGLPDKATLSRIYYATVILYCESIFSEYFMVCITP